MEGDRFTTPQTVTAVVCLGWVVALLLYDLFLVLWGYTDATVSAVCSKLFRRAPVLAFLAGLVVGHLVWPITRFYGSGDARTKGTYEKPIGERGHQD